jgi:TPR repeat protein
MRVVFPLQVVMGVVLLSPPLAVAAAEDAAVATTVTECDRLAAHPSDPDKVTAGVPTAEVRGWNDAAIWSCRQAVKRHPDDPRQRYQLGRALFYAGERAEALEHLAVSASGKHRQAQFVLGLMYTDGVPGILDVDACTALELWRDSAARGHFAARVALGRDWARGAYRACEDVPSAAQVDAWLASARSESADYYQRLLIDWAREVVAGEG